MRKSQALPTDAKTMNPSPQKSTTHWKPCQPGTIQQLTPIDAPPILERRHFLFNVGMGLAGCLTAGTVIVLAHSQNDPLAPETAPSVLPVQLSCSGVSHHLPDFVNNKIKDERLFNQIRCHLNRCPACQHTYRSLTGRPFRKLSVISDREAVGGQVRRIKECNS